MEIQINSNNFLLQKNTNSLRINLDHFIQSIKSVYNQLCKCSNNRVAGFDSKLFENALRQVFRFVDLFEDGLLVLCSLVVKQLVLLIY